MALVLKFQLSRGGGLITLDPPQFCVRPKPGLRLPYVVGFFFLCFYQDITEILLKVA